MAQASGTLQNVLDELNKTGLSEAEKQRIYGEWIVANATHTQRVFAFKPPLGAIAGGCAATFAQSFAHTFWVDGVDVVQAGSTPGGEQGFNDRLHRVEQDLRALHQDDLTAFKCLADLRKALATALAQVATELNAIDRDLAELFTRTDEERATFIRPDIVATTKFMGTTRIFGTAVSVWHTQQGILTLPVVDTIGIRPSVTPPLANPRAVAKLVHGDQEVLKSFGADKVTAKQLKEKFGDRQLENGKTLGEALADLPDDASFSTSNELVDALAAHNAIVLKATGASDAAIAGSFTDLGTDVGVVAEAPVDRLEIMPRDARAGLEAAGIDTVGKLAAASPEEIAKKLTDAGVKTTAADVAGWAATAKTLSRLGGART